MAEDVNKAAEPSPAAVEAKPEFNPADQHTWSSEQREQWNKTGDVPTPKKQDSAPAKETTSEPEGKTAAESEAATTQGKERNKPGKKTYDERIAQLTAENKALREEAERERSREAAPKPTAEKPEPKATEAPKRPNLATWTGTVEEYDVAMDKWEEHRKSEIVAQFQRDAAAEANMQRLTKQMQEVVEKYEDVSMQQLGDIAAEFGKAELPGVIQSMLNDSDVLPEVVYLFKDKEMRSNFIEQAKKNPGKAIRALAQMEADIKASLTEKKAVADDPKKAPVELKPRAPKPPSEVGGRGAAPDDALKTAAASGNFRDFEAEQNRRKFAKN